ncbi:hypothetical protein BDV33DRAFT_180325 [Aspergillus novoparasiticus]|uniref:GATA-type domain-containing protein n=1 Tax=Aspergillus novoparasiticus TaxID=986946 RepID=A0A5N6EDQ5_9EURO|nr:hypothetical protein BDV33DRAFT_180325 [Aspergillus novoparasiticus]
MPSNNVPTTNDHARHDQDTVKTDKVHRQSTVGIHKGARERSQLRQGPEAEEKSSLLREGLDERSRTMSAEVGEKSSSRQGYQRLMSSGVEEKSSLRPVPKTTAAGGKTLGGKKNKKANVPSNQRSILSFMGPAHEAGESSEPLQTSHRPGPQTTAAEGKIRGGKKGKKAIVPSNQGSILSYMGPAEEAGETSEPLQTGCITAGKRPPTEAVAENASESKRAKIIKEEPVEYADNVSVKTDEESKDTLHDKPKKVPFNPEDYVEFIIIEDEEYPDELKYEDAAGYDVEEDDLPEQVSQEAGYFEEEGFISDADRYQTAGIVDEDHEALRESFDKSMHRVIRYLWNYAQSTSYEELSRAESYIAPGMYQWLRKADPQVVYRLYQAIIPESTRTILGHDRLTCQHILALPKVSPSRREKGVYLDLVTSPSDNGGLYTGSTISIFVVRITAHRREIQRDGSVKGVHYTYIREKTNRKPHFRVVAVFPRNMPELGIEIADSEWLIRFLEAVIMIVLDTFKPGSLPQFSITQDQLNRLKSECGLRDTVFEPLNRALPTKQSVRSKLPYKCGNCPSEESSNWFLDFNASTLVAGRRCSACYQYKRTHGTERPESVYNRLPAPTSGPCSNPSCGATETTRKWYRHPIYRDRVVCNACHVYLTGNDGTERPLVTVLKRQKDQRRCIDCPKFGPGVIWHVAHDQTTEVLYRCHACYNQYQRSLPKAQDQTTQPRQCASCGESNPQDWHAKSSMCGPCHEADQQWREKRERSNCWNCLEQWNRTIVKRWSCSLREWLCNKCQLSMNSGYLRMAAHHLENLDIRCELCRTKYSKAWYPGCKSTNLLVCRRCGDRKGRGLTDFGDRSNSECGPDELTYQGSREKAGNAILKPEFFDYIKRAHNIDRSVAAIVDAKQLEDALDL